jgi:hypothetical protein
VIVGLVLGALAVLVFGADLWVGIVIYLIFSFFSFMGDRQNG